MKRQQRNLLSLTNNQRWQDLSPIEKVDLAKKIKAKAAVMFIQATEFIEVGNFQSARELFIYIADSCTCIKDPDEEVKRWTKTSIQYIGLIHQKNDKQLKNCMQIERKNYERSSILTLSFNKFSNEFELPLIESKQSQLYQEVLQYLCKINGKIFSHLNVANNYSLYIMLATYWIPFTMALVLLLLVMVYLCAPEFLSGSQQQGLIIGVPSLIFGGLLTIPMFIIFLKTPQQRNLMFFSKVLGEQLKKINENCRQNKKNLQFVMSANGNRIFVNLDKHLEVPIELSEGSNKLSQDDMINNVQNLKLEIRNSSMQNFIKSSRNFRKSRIQNYD